MSLFGTGASPFGGTGSGISFGAPATTTATTTTQNKEIVVVSPPDDTVSCLAFSPASVPNTYLVASSWDNHVRFWEVLSSGQTVAKAQQSHAGPVLDAAWSADGSKVFTCSADKTAKMWDLGSNSFIQIAQHDAPIRTLHCIQTPTHSCVMTSSWDRTLKFWDTRSAMPMLSLQLPERAYAADVLYPMAVVATAQRHVLIYNLENTPSLFKQMESPLKFQSRCVSIFREKNKEHPTGYALGSIEGRVAIQYVNTTNPKDNFTFKCHRSNGTNQAYQDIFAVNDMQFHVEHGTLATVGSDGRFSFWDKDARTKLRSSDPMEQSISCCTFDSKGQIFAYAIGYDWSRGHEGFDVTKKPKIVLRECGDELKPSQTRKS